MTAIQQMLSSLKQSGPPPTPFSPSDISGLTLWLKADALSYSDNDPVGKFDDFSGLTNDATASGSARPTFKTNQINGLPAVRFDNSDDEMDFSPIVLTDFTIFSVHSVSSFVNTLHYLLGGNLQGFCVGGTAANALVFDSSNILHSATAAITGPVLLSCDNSHIWENGVEPSYASSATLVGMTLARIGVRTDSFTTGRFAGDLSELIIYDSQLGSTDRGNVETYLMNKYAL